MCLSPLTSVLASALSFPPNPPPPVCTGRPTARKASREQHRGHGFRSRLVRVGGDTRARGLVEVNAVAGSCVLFFLSAQHWGYVPFSVVVVGGGGLPVGARVLSKFHVHHNARSWSICLYIRTLTRFFFLI